MWPTDTVGKPLHIPITKDADLVYKDFDTFGIMVVGNLVGLALWLIKTIWDMFHDKQKKHDILLEEMVNEVRSIKNDMGYVTRNMVTKSDVNTIVKEEIIYARELERRS